MKVVAVTTVIRVLELEDDPGIPEEDRIQVCLEAEQAYIHQYAEDDAGGNLVKADTNTVVYKINEASLQG